MQKRKIIQELLKEKLSVIIDPVMKDNNFNRRSNSLIYQKKNAVLTQKINIYFQSSPHFMPDVDAYLNPTFTLFIPEVTEKALDLLGENKVVLGLNPEIVINQPIYFFIDKAKNSPYLSLTLNKDNTHDLNRLKDILTTYVLPQISKINTLEDFVGIYEDNLPFSISKKDYIYFITAYKLIGQKEKARQVLENKYSKKGDSSIYKPINENLQ